jgi:hypothetical protein
MRRRRALPAGLLAGVASAGCGAYLAIKWPVVELALFGPVFLWRLVAPPRFRTHPRRNAYLVAFSLLAIGLVILLLDQPQSANSGYLSTMTAVGVTDGDQSLKGIRFSEPPTITLDAATTVPGNWNWFGTFEFTINVDKSRNREQDLVISALLPKISSPTAWEGAKPDYLQVAPLGDRQDLLRLVLHINRTTSQRRVIVSFRPHIPSHRMRLGEQRVLLSRTSMLLGYQLPAQSHPRLQVKVPLATTDLVAQPAPSYALRDVASWELGGPLTLEGNLNPVTSMGGIDITLTDRRIRLMADLAVEVLLLAGGLLLGLIIEPARDLSGHRERHATAEAVAPRQDQIEPASTGDGIGRANRRLAHVIAFLAIIRAIIQAVRRQRR